MNMGLLIAVASFGVLALLAFFGPTPLKALSAFEKKSDDDMKIVGGSFFGEKTSANEKLAEQAAEEFLLQKEKGNIEKAGNTGTALAEKLWEIAQNLIMDEGNEKHVRQVLVLASYVINKLLTERSPSPLLAQTALSVFYKRVKELSAVLDSYIMDDAALTLYLLSSRHDEPASVGEIYAHVYGEPESAVRVTEGERFYQESYKIAADIFSTHADYVL